MFSIKVCDSLCLDSYDVEHSARSEPWDATVLLPSTDDVDSALIDGSQSQNGNGTGNAPRFGCENGTVRFILTFII